jgi:hypothetical protein
VEEFKEREKKRHSSTREIEFGKIRMYFLQLIAGFTGW